MIFSYCKISYILSIAHVLSIILIQRLCKDISGDVVNVDTIQTWERYSQLSSFLLSASVCKIKHLNSKPRWNQRSSNTTAFHDVRSFAIYNPVRVYSQSVHFVTDSSTCTTATTPIVRVSFERV